MDAEVCDGVDEGILVVEEVAVEQVFVGMSSHGVQAGVLRV